MASFAMVLGVLAPVFGAAPQAKADDPAFKILVFDKTAGFRHASIPVAKAAIADMAANPVNPADAFAVDFSENLLTSTGIGGTDAAVLFNTANAATVNLAQYDAIVFNSTTGDIFNSEQEANFRAYIEGGGGFAGIHSASDTEHQWTWYTQELVGARFNNHPANQTATVNILDRTNESTKHFTSDQWVKYDEWYNFVDLQRDKIHVLMSLDEKSYSPGGGAMPADHPIAWCRQTDTIRSWYTALGHTTGTGNNSGGDGTVNTYAMPEFRAHLLGGFKIAAGTIPSGCAASQSSSFEQVMLDENTVSPMALNVAPDGTVFYIERDGRLRQIDPTTNTTSTALTLQVYSGNEDGLLGVVLDPDFEENGWIYLYYAPTAANLGGDPTHNRLSRFTYNFSTKTAAPSSEKIILKVNTQRNECCHKGGDMTFDLNGNLVLATGDNTNPFASGGYTPIDEQPGRAAWDAQGTSGNTNDLRGKLIRITPQDDGTYTIPAGNLFAPGTPLTRPEVYAMGFRNPFRIGLDHETGNIFVGEYGPDAGSNSSTRGPRGSVEWNVVSQPGNYGWPYCHGRSNAQGAAGDVGTGCYNDYNFANSTSGAVFNPNALVNDSPNNTGMTNLPAVIAPTMWYPNSSNTYTPEIGSGGGAPMGGPTYEYDPLNPSDTKWPAYWDGKAIFAEWNQGKMYSIQMDAATGTQVRKINTILPAIFDAGSGGGNFYRGMDMEWGPDGALYVIDWGSGFDGNNANSSIFRVDYTAGEASPVAHASADVTNSATAPLEVNFTGDTSFHPFDYPITYSWNFGDGSPAVTTANATHTYTANGQYTAQLTVTDDRGGTSVSNVEIVVGNAAPTIEIVFPENGGFFEWGDQIPYEIVVTDPDATEPIDCENVSLLPALGHDTHAHDYGQLFGCEGYFQTARDAGHGLEANLFWVLSTTYQDDGGAVGIPLTGYGSAVLNPTLMQAEYYDATGQLGQTTGGVQLENTTDSLGGGRDIAGVDVGDWWAHNPVNLVGMDGVNIRLASAAGGTIEARFGNDVETATVIGTLNYTATGGATTYAYQNLAFSNVPSGEGTLFFVNTAGTARVNYYEFQGDGVESNSAPTATLSVNRETGVAPLSVTATLADVIDPDGAEGAPVDIEWDSGQGYQPGTASITVNYTEPGDYILRARLTDELGAYTILEQPITVDAQEIGECFLGRSDGFDGTMLDSDRWDSNVRVDQTLVVEDGTLKIPAAVGDLYQNSTPVSPNLVLQDMPTGAWTMDTKVTFPARIGYQQAGLLVYANDNNYVKLTMQARTGDSTPNAATRVVQMLKEDNGTASETNSPNLGAEFPDTVYLRIVSDGAATPTLTGYYSANGSDWTAITTTRNLSGITEAPLKVGVWASASTSAQATAAPIVTAEFDWFTITPDDTAVPVGPNDEFDGDRIDPCRWEVLNENGNLYRVQGGNLELDTTTADINNTSANPIPNLTVQEQPDGDWTVETKLDATAFDRQYHAGGIMLYFDDANYIKLYVEQQSATARQVEFRNEVNNVIGTPNPNVTGAPTTVWLRMTKTGTTYGAWYSYDGTTWLQVMANGTTGAPVAFTNAAVADAKIGLFALGTSSQGENNRTAKFDYFHVISADPVFDVDATVAPAVDGTNGWHKTQPVTVTLATENGDPELQDYIEYNLGEGWMEYTTPLVLTAEGTHTVQYRASETGGEDTAEKSVTVKIDTTVPTVDGNLVVDPEDAEDRTLEITAADATSGVASIQYSSNGGTSWTTYTAPVALPLTAQTIQVRSTDGAGNVSAIDTVEVPAIGECGEVGPNDQFDGAALDTCRWTVINENTAGYRVEGGFLKIDTTQADIYSAGGSIPNIIVQDQPSGDWTIETKVDTSTFDRQYQNAGLIAYIDADNYIKWDIVTTNAAGSTIARNFEFRHEVAGAVQNPQNNVNATATGGIAHLRLAKVGNVFTASYSTDGTTWTDFTNTFTDANLSANAQVGLYTLGSTSSGTAGKTATFDYFTVDAEEVDVTAPTVSGTANGRTVTLTAEDTESGVASIEYQLPGGEWTAYTAPFDVPGTEAVTVSIRATDNAGNVSTTGTVEVAAVEEPELVVDRIAGANRFEVAVNISQEAYPDGAPVVYVANGEFYADALSAGPAAAYEGGPLLLVRPGELPAVISAEIARLDPEKIVVVGGVNSVSETVFGQLAGLTDEAVRIAGANRYEASRNIAEYAFGGADVPLAYIATGEKFPDALAAGGAAGSQDAPVILVKGDAATLDAATATLLDEFNTTETRVLGGEASVTPGVFNGVDAITDATRLGGVDRYEAARNINADAFDTAERVFLATGANFPDALAGSAWAAGIGAPLYVTPGTCVTAGILADLEALGTTHVTLLGGEASLSPEVFSLTSC
ncbi:ThuA domain-containing protein [Antiquaquibacter oligotrophicus]|uniref:ThuA domain-containing protein n=1 Tax=Antiquaquibacter oligotrophicus TaxID=2880260 RepID=UPI002AC8E960|nr:ThuA domain-containing protein [Antiquaquibacter oligotrophicus]UDF12431.1 ThuA domain-containing protein [Antiquaquibacter oligotrophicus]